MRKNCNFKLNHVKMSELYSYLYVQGLNLMTKFGRRAVLIGGAKMGGNQHFDSQNGRYTEFRLHQSILHKLKTLTI